MSKYVPPHLRNQPEPASAGNTATGANAGDRLGGNAAPPRGAPQPRASGQFQQQRQQQQQQQQQPHAAGFQQEKQQRQHTGGLKQLQQQQQQKRTSSYMPPHLRNRPTMRTPPDVPSQQNSYDSTTETAATGSKDVKAELTEEERLEEEKNREEEEKKRHPDLNSEETVCLGAFFHDHSETFQTWGKVRKAAYHNEHIGNFFDQKNANKSHSKREGAYVGASIGKIFSQFYRYAVDIDNGVYYSERARDIAEATGECWFLDFGFAPGGMSDLLLDAHPDIKGVGVTLESEKGGNVYLEEMDTDQEPYDRFYTLIGDVIDMARDDLDIGLAAKLPDNFTGFDFVIVGITIHQEWEGDNMNELKDLLHFAQLYFAFKHLKPGGMVLMRMHMSVRVVDSHMLALMISCFDVEHFVGRAVGKVHAAGVAEQNKAKRVEEDQKKKESNEKQSSLRRMQQKIDNQQEAPEAEISSLQALDLAAVATKPFSTFSMRKTYWVLYQGFVCSDSKRSEVLARLQRVLEAGVFAYGFNAEENRFNLPVLMPGSMDEILAEHGDGMIAVLETVWKKQVLALEGFMEGRTDKFCRRGLGCNRKKQGTRGGRGGRHMQMGGGGGGNEAFGDRCNLAHLDSEMIPQVLWALRAVDVRSRDRLMGFQR